MEPTYTTKKLSDLAPADYNPRKISDDALAGLSASIDEFGIVEPIVWNKRTGNVVGGHQRLRVLRERGIEETTVCEVDLPKGKERALNVALNNPHIAGDFDDGLQALLCEIRDDDVDLFRDVQLDKLLVEDAEVDEDEVPALPEETTAQAGDMWELGRHRLICGSSADEATVRRVVGEDRATCMWTDPPYGIEYAGRVNPSKTRSSATARDDSKGAIDSLVQKVFANANIALEKGASFYASFTNDPENFLFLMEAATGAGWRNKQILTIAKDRLIISRLDYHPQTELILYGAVPREKGGHGRISKNGWYGDAKQSNLFHMKKPQASKLHPTMKPVPLVASMLVNSTRPNDWVYEPFGGSGTTLIACEQLKRRCIAIELEPAYCDVIIQRWEELTGKKAVKC